MGKVTGELCALDSGVKYTQPDGRWATVVSIVCHDNAMITYLAFFNFY